MKKIIPMLIVGALVLSGIGAIAIDADERTNLEVNTSLIVTEPIFSSVGDYITVHLSQETSVSMLKDKPILPVVTKVFDFKPGTEITNVQVIYDVKEYTLSGKIALAPEPVPLMDNSALKASKKIYSEVKTYASTKPYPAEPYTVNYAFGRYKGDMAQMVIVKIFSQYVEAEDTLIAPYGGIKINIKYIEPSKQSVINNDYDMLIIAPEEFSSNLQPLIEHKNAKNVPTYLETVESIYTTYDGRNEPEDIKLCIKNAYEEHNISYVLLAGGRKKQTMEWWVPEFRGNNIGQDNWESGYAVDLYYADIYKNNGTEFEDWDSNENEIFGEYRGFDKDIIDFYPDVALSRIPFHYGFELDIVVDKIINYETGTDDSWFKKAIMIAGDTFPASDSYYEGEMETGHTAEMLEDDGFSIEKLWTSTETMTGVRSVVKAISAGAGFVHFAGHGNPSTWSTHPPKDKDTWITGLSWTDMPRLRNREKLPFVMVGGCHNAQFNATMAYIPHGLRTMGFKEYFDMNDSDDGPNEDGKFGKFWLKEWVPRDFCSWLLLKKNGGSIGSVGHSGLGYGVSGQGALDGLGGWIEPRMFDAYANQSIDILGEMHDQAIVDYINIIGNVNTDPIHRKTIETFTLIGDPSLKLGGY